MAVLDGTLEILFRRFYPDFDLQMTHTRSLSQREPPGVLRAFARELQADGSWPSHTKLRSAKYLIEPDLRSVMQHVAMMLGLKQFRNAAIAIAGIELMHRVRKGQFRLRRLGVQGRTARARNLERGTPALRVVRRSATRMPAPRICAKTRGRYRQTIAAGRGGPE